MNALIREKNLQSKLYWFYPQCYESKLHLLIADSFAIVASPFHLWLFAPINYSRRAPLSSSVFACWLLLWEVLPYSRLCSITHIDAKHIQSVCQSAKVCNWLYRNDCNFFNSTTCILVYVKFVLREIRLIVLRYKKVVDAGDGWLPWPLLNALIYTRRSLYLFYCSIMNELSNIRVCIPVRDFIRNLMFRTKSK